MCVAHVSCENQCGVEYLLVPTVLACRICSEVVARASPQKLFLNTELISMPVCIMRVGLLSIGVRDMRTDTLGCAADIALVWSFSRSFEGNALACLQNWRCAGVCVRCAMWFNCLDDEDHL